MSKEDLTGMLNEIKALRHKLTEHIENIRENLLKGNLLDDGYVSAVVEGCKSVLSYQHRILETEACSSLVHECKADSMTMTDLEAAVGEWESFGRKYLEIKVLLHNFQHLAGEQSVVQPVADIAKADYNRLTGTDRKNIEEISSLLSEYGIYKDTAEVINAGKFLGDDRKSKANIIHKFDTDFYFALEAGEISFAEKQEAGKEAEPASSIGETVVADEKTEIKEAEKAIDDVQEDKIAKSVDREIAVSYDIGHFDFTQGSKYLVSKKTSLHSMKRELHGWPEALEAVFPAAIVARGTLFVEDAIKVVQEGIKKDWNIDDLKKALQFLENQGYFVHIGCENKELIYVASAKLYDFKKKNSKAIHNRKTIGGLNSTLTAQLTDELAAMHYVQAAIMKKISGSGGLYNVAAWMKDIDGARDISVYMLKNRQEAVLCVVSDFEHAHKTNEKISDEISSALNDESCPVRVVIYAGANVEHAGKVADNYKYLWEDNASIKAYIYSLTEDAVYTWPDKSLVNDVYEEVKLVIPPSPEDESEKEEDNTLQTAESKEENDEPDAVLPDIVDEDKEAVEEPHTALNEVEEESLQEKLENDSTVEVAPVIVEKKTADVVLPENIFTPEELTKQACNMVNQGNIYCALAFLKAYDDSEGQLLYKQFAYGVNDPTAGCQYMSNEYFSTFTGENVLCDYLGIAAGLRMSYYDTSRYDYKWKAVCKDNLLNSKLIEDFASLKELIYEFIQFKENNNCGIDALADFRTVEEKALKDKIGGIRKKAEEYIGVLTGPVKENAPCPPFIEMQKLMFAKDEDLVKYLIAVKENDTGKAKELREFLCDTFMREDNCSVDDIDREKLQEYITLYWELAKNNISHRLVTTKLMGAYNQKIVNKITRAIDIMCRWLSCQGQIGDVKRDEAMAEYRKKRSKVLDRIEAGMEELQGQCGKEADEAIKAGLGIICYTLQDIKARISGDYREGMDKYFYIDFVRSDQILLDEFYAPVVNRKYDAIKGLSFADRLRRHQKAMLRSFDERVDEICNSSEDYGTAGRIYDYCEDAGIKLARPRGDIEANITCAVGKAKQKKQDFIAELDYMESEGQIDNLSDICNKDIIQGMIEEACEEAEETKDYGFFDKVIEACKEHIMANAKVIGDRLSKRLQNQLNANADRQVPEDKLEYIQNAIKKQEYTIAEDGINRLWNDESEGRYNYRFEDYLADFVDNYDDYCKKALPKGSVARRAVPHKDRKGADLLRDNWLKNNFDIAEDKIENFLEALEFDVETVKEEQKDKDNKTFLVTLSKPLYGGRFVPKHTIAAFGSEAVEDGFRVVTICGNKTAKNLLELQKKVSPSYHTLVLLDWALNLSDRRLLARKIKEEGAAKVFAVLDRTMLFYLMANYTKDQMNQMLMSLLMPYSYYQPYTPSSSTAMPVEMFIGRRDELTKIKDPKGPQLVYGGRQLGKSALLRMAQQDVDRDDKGSRAVLVDIKDMSVKAAAEAVGHRLAMEGIIEGQKPYSWKNIVESIEVRISPVPKELPYLLLLLDEGDEFIQDSSRDGYQAVAELKRLQESSRGRFKFVIAGLHNIVRHNKKANDNNGIITHLESITIKPFAAVEAKELLKRPLEYLGIRFPEEDERLATLIIANANYFPGLIQLYCKNLIECMKKDYAGYNEVETPPYKIEKEHIQKVLNSNEFKEMVQEKFEITLKLDKDNYYYIIALLMASLYHENQGNQQFSAENVLEEGKEYGIDKLADMPAYKMKAFMDELCELNILRASQDGKYSFTRYRFCQMMGTQDEVDNKLMEFLA